jgi:hypothetical protein
MSALKSFVSYKTSYAIRKRTGQNALPDAAYAYFLLPESNYALYQHICVMPLLRAKHAGFSARNQKPIKMAICPDQEIKQCASLALEGRMSRIETPSIAVPEKIYENRTYLQTRRSSLL